MKGIGSRWHSFEYTLVQAGPCAVAVDRSMVGVTQIFLDCLLVRVVVEPGDCPLTAEAVRAIRYLCLVSEAVNIVIAGTPHCATPGSRFTPAVHSSDVLTHLADTLDVLSDLAERLDEYGERVHLMPFGWNVTSRAETSARQWELPSITVPASGGCSRGAGSSRNRSSGTSLHWSLMTRL
ncbi:hypothetical protein ACQP1G_13220 [Nocardia sp. CA-107356]|uniref:hypothetical protein n=1 Tax=Nocardia sp. CA-107356 TaxID=3239972 RepID=UPI003D937E8B